MRLRWSLLALLLAVLVGCVPESRPSAAPEFPLPSPAASPTEPVATAQPSVSVAPTDEPVTTPSSTPEPTPTQSAEPSDPSPSASTGPGAAAACSGSDNNRLFFEKAAAVLDWTVYCAVLPSGWFVQGGDYTRGGGGRLEIVYRGPGAARLELHEGAFCTDPADCVPTGPTVGDAAFGDKTGPLFATDEGGWALAVDQAETISWFAIGTGLDEEAFRALTAALAAVND
jgi:hypothetical protein